MDSSNNFVEIVQGIVRLDDTLQDGEAFAPRLRVEGQIGYLDIHLDSACLNFPFLSTLNDEVNRFWKSEIDKTVEVFTPDAEVALFIRTNLARLKGTT